MIVSIKSIFTVLLAFAIAAQGAPRRPNFVVILADDMGYGDVGCFGSPSIKTPNLDRMAQEGMKLTHTYTAQPICTPARAALMTGRLPVRNGMYQNVTLEDDGSCKYRPGESSVLWWNSIGGIPKTEVTLPQIMSDNGYATALVGKWHIGIGRNYEYLPTQKGFQHFYGIPLWHMGDQGNQTEIPDVPMMKNNTIIGRLYKTFDITTSNPSYVDYIRAFVSQFKNEPFFLYFAPDNTHAPTYTSAAFKGKSPRGMYGDAVEEMDWTVGEVYKILKEFDLDNDTFVIWSSDNGPALYQQVEHNDTYGYFQGGSAGPLYGGKGTTWEGGIRMPTIARWPGKIPANTVSNELSSLMDIYPTILKQANISVPKGVVLDGKDISEVLLKDGQSPHEFIFHWRGDTLYAVSHGNYKGHFWTQGARMYQIPGIQKHSPPLLFNVGLDPAESFPLLSNAYDKNYDAEIQAITQAAKQHINSFTPGTPQFNTCDRAAGMWKPDLPQPPSHITCCVGGGN